MRCGLLMFTMLAATPGTSVADSPRTIDAAIHDLQPDQRLRIQTSGHGTLEGRLVRAQGDSLYLQLAPAGAVGLAEINRLWRIDDHGLGRGLLWGGGVLLFGGLMTFEAGSQNIDRELEAAVFFGTTVAVAVFAFFKGMTGDKETLVYSRIYGDSKSGRFGE